ncbi:MAG TPA: S53 family peptidase [Acidimicrobiales bacterium]|jgi:subtilase family serine protease|nr:S53 family peptidase [Acidimicrobiales bacterium]
MPKFRKGLAAVALGALTVPLIAISATASPPQAANRKTLPGSAPEWANPTDQATTLAAPSALSARVYLAPRGGQAQLDAAVAAVSTPGSATYRHFLTPAQYRARFAPSAAEVDSVEAWLTGAGLHVDGVAAGNRSISVSGTAQAVQHAFGVTVAEYHHNGRVEQAPSSDISVPASIAGQVLAVNGLSTPQRVQHSVAPPPAGFRNAQPCSQYYGQVVAGSLPSFNGTPAPYSVCGYTPSQFRSAYGVTASGLTGQGTTVAITDAYAAPTILADANTYSTRRGDAPFGTGQFSQSAPGTFTDEDECDASSWYGEETLDVEAVHGIAPAANVTYYGAASCNDDDLLSTLQQVVDDNQASIVTNSWGEAEMYETSGSVAAYEQVFQQGAMQGIGFLFSSGDSGDERAATHRIQTDYPTSDPYVTSVGGTSDAIAANGTFQFQTGWGTDKYVLSKNGKIWQRANPFYLYGAGGGVSRLSPQPAYQHGVVPPGGRNGRAVPDIAMDADPTTGMLIGETQTFPDGVYYDEFRLGGTSLASPLMAGMQALATQAAGGRLGFANPAIYQRARTAGVYRDVTLRPYGLGNVRADYANGINGDGGVVYSLRTFGDDATLQAASGWDDVTGVGTPTARYLASYAVG